MISKPVNNFLYTGLISMKLEHHKLFYRKKIKILFLSVNYQNVSITEKLIFEIYNIFHFGKIWLSIEFVYAKDSRIFLFLNFFPFWSLKCTLAGKNCAMCFFFLMQWVFQICVTTASNKEFTHKHIFRQHRPYHIFAKKTPCRCSIVS